MSKEMATYLKDVADATIQHMLTVHPYEPTSDVDFGGAARVYLATIGFILCNRPDLIEDSELRTKLGFSGQAANPQQQEGVVEQQQNKTEEDVKDDTVSTFQRIPFIRPISTEQVKTAPEQLNKVTLYPDFDVEELRTLLIREILSSTTLLLPDAEGFATYLMELDQFKCILNSVLGTVSPYNSQYRSHMRSLTEEVLLTTLRYAPMAEILQKWWSERSSTAEKEKIAGEVRKLLIKPLALIIPEVNSLEGFVKFVSEHPLFLEMMAATAEIPVITHFGRRRKTLQETVQATIVYKLPLNQLYLEWKQSLNKTPTDPIQPSPEVPSKTEKVYDFLSLSFFKAAVTSPQSGFTERYSKEEAVSRLVEVVGIPSQTANVVAEELLQMFSGQVLKKCFESTLGVQRLFWIWVRSKYSFDFFKCLTNLDVYETKVWIHRLLGSKEELQSAINDGLRIQNLSFLDLIYLLIRLDVNGGTNRYLGPLQSLLSKFNFDALLDTWKRGAVVY